MIHPVKKLLALAASDESTVDDVAAGRNLYRRYLASVLGFDVSHSRLSKMPDHLLDRFYSAGKPSAPPYCLNFDPEGVSRVERAAGRRIVILRRLGNSDVAKVHDRRCYDDAESANADFSSGPPLVLSLAWEAATGSWTLAKWSGALPENSRLYEWRFIAAGMPSPEDSCVLEKVQLALPDFEPAEQHAHGPDCRSLTRFCCKLDAFRQQLPAAGVIVVSHLRARLLAAHSWRARDHTFGVLGTAWGDRPTVVSFTSDWRWAYRLQDEYAESVLRVLGQRGGRRPPRIDLGSTFGPLPRDAAAADDVDDDDCCTKTEGQGLDCDCGPCSRAWQFSRHMDVGGRQKIYAFPLSGFQHLQTLGLFSVAAEQTVLACCDLSTASFDVEALTCPAGGADAGNEDLALPFATVGTTKYPREVLASQEPILLAWTDHLRDVSGLPVHVYDIEDEGCPASAFPANFVADLLAGRDAAEASKRERLSGMYDFLAPLKQAHSSFFAPADGDPEADRKLAAVEVAWRHNPFGLFETHLDRLASRYLCFGFNRSVPARPTLSLASHRLFLCPQRGLRPAHPGLQARALPQVDLQASGHPEERRLSHPLPPLCRRGRGGG
jgi:hypothetical protein